MEFASQPDEAETEGDFRLESGAYVAFVSVAGFQPGELKVDVAGQTVTVEGRRPGSGVGRRLELPADADPRYLTATLADGFLCLRTCRQPVWRRRVPIECDHGLYHGGAGVS